MPGSSNCSTLWASEVLPAAGREKYPPNPRTPGGSIMARLHGRTGRLYADFSSAGNAAATPRRCNEVAGRSTRHLTVRMSRRWVTRTSSISRVCPTHRVPSGVLRRRIEHRLLRCPGHLGQRSAEVLPVPERLGHVAVLLRHRLLRCHDHRRRGRCDRDIRLMGRGV